MNIKGFEPRTFSRDRNLHLHFIIHVVFIRHILSKATYTYNRTPFVDTIKGPELRHRSGAKQGQLSGSLGMTR